MALVTVFTPTYNRRDLLPRVYNSLLNQTDYDFLWLVIDDGSVDETASYINEIKEKTTKFEIKYYYKENGGLHTGYNEAIKHLNTELCLCCDSDDWLPSDCIEKVKKLWLEKQKSNCAGIIGLDYDKAGKVIGEKLPDVDYVDMNELYIKGQLIGDKKLVVRSELYKQLSPMKTQYGEKNFNPNYLNVVISENYDWIVLNENLCFVEYQPEGMTNSIFKQYVNSPNSFIELRKLYLSLKKATFSFKCRHIIHYDAECLLADRKKDIFSPASPNRFLSVLLFPFGMGTYWYILRKVKK